MACLLASVTLRGLAAQTNLIFPIPQVWRYWQTNSLDAVNWKATSYDDSGWPAGGGLLYVESGALPAPKTTPLVIGKTTYYFRTHFTYSGTTTALSLMFSNLIDDGAVFYLNGVEVQRLGMPTGPITYTNFSSRSVTDATNDDVFTLRGAPLASLVVGDNVLAVEVHQVNAGSSDIVFGSALISIIGTNVTRGPYLQSGSPTNIVVRWRTDFPADSRVRYGTDVGSLDLVTDAVALTNEHEITLTGLVPGTKYYYSVGMTTEMLAGGEASHFFVTSPVPGTPKPTRIWVLGDSGTKNANAAAVRDAYYNFTGSRHTDLWLMLGDNAYSNGTDSDYQAAVFDMYPTMLRKSVLWSTLGNHETYSTNPNGNHAYFDIFTFPTAGQVGGAASGNEHYYSFDYANIHFICLDSMESSRFSTNDMAIWLTNDLVNASADWLIALWHHPPYTKGSHDSDTETELIEMRENLLPLLEAGGVDLVLCGHSHSYERSYLLDGHYGKSGTLQSGMKIDPGNGREGSNGGYQKPIGGFIPHQGAVYAVAGSSGQTSGGTLNHPAMYISLNVLGSMVLDINSNRLDALFLREDGTTNDVFTMLKVNYPPVVSNVTISMNADGTTNFTLVASDINHDPVTFTTNSLPARGLISSFSPVTGLLAYVPAHGFTGADSFNYSASDGRTSSAPATVTLAVLPLADADYSGLPDAWETRYGVTDPNGDDDLDGLTNAREYWANTNPTNAASGLRILSVTVSESGHATLTWASVGGTRYRVSYCDGDAGGGIAAPFTDIVRHVTQEMDPAPIGAGSTQTFTDNLPAPSTGARYFRIHTVQ
jgi:hypothetical protein